MADVERIAKNTIFMYIRMFIIMGVTIYTSRVVLDKLGVDDYGLFNAVAGVVGMLTFLNNTLAKGTSRFLTFELGNNNEERLKTTFSTAFYAHMLLMVLVVIVLETVGLWFLNHKLVIPEDRMYAAQWVYQISILTMCVGVIQVPYTSSIIAHEDMGLYAYLGILEAVGKLAIVYVLSISDIDKLILYSILLLLMQSIIFGVYYVFNRRKYIESKLRSIFDREIFKEMLGFSGWNIIANLAETLKLQGSNILINLFFRPALVAAMAVSNQITNVLMNFVYQFTTALNPQIIKSYASGNFEESERLTLQSTVFVFDLVLLICLPLFFVIDPILNLWLVEVPEQTADFVRIALVSQVLGVFNVTFYTPMIASGKLKTNSLWAIYLGIGQFVLAYVLYKLGFGVLWLPYLLLATTLVYSFYIKPKVLYKEMGYNMKQILRCYWRCFKVLCPAVLSSGAVFYLLKPNNIIQYAIVLCSTVVIVFICSLAFMDKDSRTLFAQFIKNKFLK